MRVPRHQHLLEPVVKYGSRIRMDGLSDETVLSLLTWPKSGALESG